MTIFIFGVNFPFKCLSGAFIQGDLQMREITISHTGAISFTELEFEMKWQEKEFTELQFKINAVHFGTLVCKLT